MTRAAAAPSLGPAEGGRLLRRLIAVEVRDEIRAIVREPSALGFTILMPVAMFTLFLGIFGRHAGPPVDVGATMLASFGTFGALAVTVMNTGIGLAADRERGWHRVKQAAAVPVPVSLAARTAAAMLGAALVPTAMAATAAAMGHLAMSPVTLARLVAVLVVGAATFVPFGLAVGSRLSATASAAVLNGLLMPTAIASGLWMPLDLLPPFVAALAPWLPPYHLAELAHAQVRGGSVMGSLAVLGLTLVVGAVLFTLADRRRV